MATAEALPALSAHADPERKESYGDEKFNEKGDHSSADIADSESFKGNVYDDIRVIDMGEDGKERPIGTSCVMSSNEPAKVIYRDGRRCCHTSYLPRG